VKGVYVLAMAAVFALPVFAGLGVAAQPCGRAVIDDWYDNGTFDRAWDCECLRDAIDLLPEDAAPYSSVEDDFQRQLEECEGQPVVTLRDKLETGAQGSDESIGVSEDAFPWGYAIVGGLALGLAALVGVAVQRLRR
jgi:hypothetical protein